MSEYASERVIDGESVATMLRAAGLQVDPGRLDGLAGLLAAANAAAHQLDAAAATVTIEAALAPFDPAWPAEGRGA